jgi:predicted AAA+ superfamily ATPase
LEAMSLYHLKKGMLIVNDNQVKKEPIPKQIELIPAWKWLVDM